MINEGKIYSYFDDNHGPLIPSTHGWYTGTCPYCGSQKLSVNPEHKTVKCWKGCFTSGYVVTFIKNYYGIQYIEASEILDDYTEKLRLVPKIGKKERVEASILPEGFKPILGDVTKMGERARNYLRDRGFDLNYMDMLGVGYVDVEGEFFGYLIIPLRRNGDIYYFIGRDFIGNFPRYKNPSVSEYGVGKSELLFNEEALTLHNKIYILEGWADAATIGSEAVATQGTVLSDAQTSIILSSQIEDVIIVPDGFFYKAGLENASKFVGRKRVKILDLDDYSTEDKKDVNSLGLSLILELEQHTPYINNLHEFYVTARAFSTRSINTHSENLLV